jgi:hypothetical protein
LQAGTEACAARPGEKLGDANEWSRQLNNVRPYRKLGVDSSFLATNRIGKLSTMSAYSLAQKGYLTLNVPTRSHFSSKHVIHHALEIAQRHGPMIGLDAPG